MNKITATELNKHPGQVLNMAIKSPVIIEKTGLPTVVLISYEYFNELENCYFGTAAQNREKNSEWVSIEESEKFLKDV